jgi:CHAT domain-containing protein
MKRQWLKGLLRKRSHRFWQWLCLGLLLVSLSAIPLQAKDLKSAQALTLRGEHQFAIGDFQAALESWQQAERDYRQADNSIGVIGTQLNQAKALQELGFYRRAQTLLEQLLPIVQSQPDSDLKVNVLLTYGHGLRLVGDVTAAQRQLEVGLAIAQTLNAPTLIQAAHLHLGNCFLAQKRDRDALDQFQLASELSGPLQISASLQRWQILQQDHPAQAVSLLAEIEQQLATMPPSQRSIYGRIELARLLLQPKTTLQSVGNKVDTQQLKTAQLLKLAAQQAKSIGNRRAESYAIGYLGQMYEQSQQWSEAKYLTESALRLAQTANVPEIIYQWQWQMGRLLKATGNLPAATTAYVQAVETLQSLRQDLVTTGQTAQFTFRDQVEPVYRELVDLLLQPDASQADLKKAGEVVEALQLAELNNFFREACLQGEPRQVDQIDSTAAVIYPVILVDRLEVILSLPNQPLRHYATRLPKAEIEATVQQFLQSMRSTSFATERLPVAQTLYRWLVEPALPDLMQQDIKTLVFVLDGSLRGIPMAALYNGKEYLIEQFQVALTPGLQLLGSTPLQQNRIHALLGGVSAGTTAAIPLPGVEKEISQIKTLIPATVLLNQAFTIDALNQQVQENPYTVVHLASHGQFSSQAGETYIQTWGGRLTINGLRSLLDQRSVSSRTAIELLVLSACETAEGDGQAALGMAGVAVRSGARSTLATLWIVNDESTAAFVTEFYQRLVQNQSSKAEAVQQAQRSLIHSETFSHPFYWAPYTLIGNWL